MSEWDWDKSDSSDEWDWDKGVKYSASATVKLPPPKPVSPAAEKRKSTPTNSNRRNYSEPGVKEYIEEVLLKSLPRGLTAGVTGIADLLTDPVLSIPGNVLSNPMEAVKDIVQLARNPKGLEKAMQFPVTTETQKALDPVMGAEEEVANKALNLSKRGARLAGEIAIPVGPIAKGRAVAHVLETLAGAGTGVAGGEIAAQTLGEESRPLGEIVGVVPGVAVAAWLMPVTGRVTSAVGQRSRPKAGASTNHAGVDLAAAEGTPVKAPTNLTVTNTGHGGKRGRWVEAVDDEGNTHTFMHLSGSRVKVNDKLSQGEPFALSGATGNVTGPNLHWSVKGPNGNVIDPLKYKPTQARFTEDDVASPKQMAEVNERLAPDDAIDAGPGTRESRWDSKEDMSTVTDVTEPTLPVTPEDNVVKLADVRDNRTYDQMRNVLDSHIQEWQGIQDNIQNSRPLDADQIDVAVERFRQWDEMSKEAADKKVPQDVQDMMRDLKGYINDAIVLSGGKSPVERTPTTPTKSEGPKTPDNDPFDPNSGGGGGLGRFVQSLLNDESGSYRGYRGGPRGPEGPMEPGPPTPPVVSKLLEGIKIAKSARKAQSAIYSEELSRRTKEAIKVSKFTEGPAGLYAEKAQLKGAYEHPDYEGIRSDFSPEEQIELHRIIKTNNAFGYWDKFHAREGLEKMLDGVIPQPKELKLLDEVFNTDLSEVFKKHKPQSWFARIANIPRTARSTLDLSAPFRQGITLIHRKEFWKAFGPMLKSLVSEDAFKASQLRIRAMPEYQLMKKADIAFTDLGADLHAREEAIMSDLVEKVPGYGRLVRGSNRAYVTFLNELRANTAASMIRDMGTLGLDLGSNQKALKELGHFINMATGRGNLPDVLKAASPVLNAALWSPRLMASRIHLLNPLYYAKTPFIKDPAVRYIRKEAIKALLAYGTFVSSVLGLSYFAGADVETDPNSSDFAKIRGTGKYEKLRMEVSGGGSTYLRLYSRLITGIYKTQKGEEKEIGKDFLTPTKDILIADFLSSKEAPLASFMHSWLRGSSNSDPLNTKNVIGEERNIVPTVTGANKETFDELRKNPALQLILPMFAEDVVEGVQEYGAEGALLTAPAGIGASVEIHQPREKKSKAKSFSNSDWDFSKTSGRKSEWDW